MRAHAIPVASLAVVVTLGGAPVLSEALGEEEGQRPAGPVLADTPGDAEGRYSLRVLYQPERDLNNSDPYINVLIDRRTGQSWVLRYAKKPGGHERGYVWQQIPFAPEPLPAPGN